MGGWRDGRKDGWMDGGRMKDRWMDEGRKDGVDGGRWIDR